MVALDRLEYYRQRYAALKPGWVPSTTYYQNQVLQAITPGSRILDLGCGRGGIVERLYQQGRWFGIDPDIGSLREHRRPEFSRSLSFSELLPFGAETFDVVVSSWVMEHAAHPQALFNEVARVLRPGGRFFLLTPNARHPIPRLSQLLAHMESFQKRIVPQLYGRAAEDAFPVHYLANTPEQLMSLAQQAGLRCLRIAYIEDPAYFVWGAMTFRLAVWLEQRLPHSWKVHLVGEFERPVTGR